MRNWMKHFFVPHRGNNHRPGIFAEQGFSLVIFILFLFQILFLFSAFMRPAIPFLAEIVSNTLVELTNENRKEAAVPTLVVNNLLQRAAALKAQDMAAKGYFAHTAPDGTTPWHWLSKVGYTYQVAGENLAVNFTDSKDVEQAWMNSPTHRANLLNTRFSEIGIATASGVYQGKPAIFVVQFFGTPLTHSQFEIPVIQKNALPRETLVVAGDTKPKITPEKTNQENVKGSSVAVETEKSFSDQKKEITGRQLISSIGSFVASNPSRVMWLMLSTMMGIILFALCMLIGRRAWFVHADLLVRAGVFLGLISGALLFDRWVSFFHGLVL